MKDKYFVPFETAKQLKRKRYNKVTIFYYDSDDYGKELLAAPSYFCGYSNEQWDKLINGGGKYISAPTYHEVLDWLEGKGILISCNAYRDKKYDITVKVLNYAHDIRQMDYPTREEALNAAILKALELI